jgi:C4-type Zn-finger protein
MKCPSCQTDTHLKVINSRETHNVIRRRRECEECKYRLTTYEYIEPMSKQEKLELLGVDINDIINKLGIIQKNIRDSLHFAGTNNRNI